MSVGLPNISDDLIKSANLNYTNEEKEFINTVAYQQIESWGEVTSTIYSTKLLERALDNHAKALIKSSESSEKYSKSLTNATWALVAATVLLAIITIVVTMS